MNFLFITADDLNYNSLGAFGCTAPDISPNLDRLAGRGLCFDNAHVTIAVCQPSRQCLMTGLYPHHNGSPGFNPIKESVPTLTQVLGENGYYNGIIWKVEHLQPEKKFCWDYCSDVYNFENLHGRSPYIYRRDSAEFFKKVKESGKPFFFMVNSHDPHRPFAGSEDELTRFYGYNTYAARYYQADEIPVPGFLPDLPDVRRELAQYYSSVHRCDETIGGVLEALEESGLAADTLIIFLSDNGMSFPFSKANCYLNSTKTPFIAYWPGVTAPGSRNTGDFISWIDFTPTILEAAGIPKAIPCDGRSYLSLLRGEEQPDRDMVFTQFNITAANNPYPMRCVQTAEAGYIFNAWADGTTFYKNEAKMGLTYAAMKTAALEDPQIAERVHFFDYRCREEFYDFSRDPNALDNLMDQAAYGDQIQSLRTRLRNYLLETDDPVLPDFDNYLEKMYA
ncbi:arylsulfatase [Spirochaetia bacterium]|nr:arylsulfatase [Spirochaetia bacterium]